MEIEAHPYRRSRFSSRDRLVAIGLTILAVVSPLYIDRKLTTDSAYDEEPIDFPFWLPFLLMLLIFCIIGSLYVERSSARFDANWIHRVGGSSYGIVVILVVLAFVLKFKASVNNWEG